MADALQKHMRGELASNFEAKLRPLEVAMNEQTRELAWKNFAGDQIDYHPSKYRLALPDGSSLFKFSASGTNYLDSSTNYQEAVSNLDGELSSQVSRIDALFADDPDGVYGYGSKSGLTTGLTLTGSSAVLQVPLTASGSEQNITFDPTQFSFTHTGTSSTYVQISLVIYYSAASTVGTFTPLASFIGSLESLPLDSEVRVFQANRMIQLSPGEIEYLYVSGTPCSDFQVHPGSRITITKIYN